MKHIVIIFFSLFILLSSKTEAQENPLWMRYPAISPDGNSIVFSYKGDIWKVDAKGGTAIPLTLHEAYDFMPVWSGDGKTIAFASNRYGDFDIFTIPAEGGQPTRLTFYSSDDYPYDFSSNGTEIIFSSLRIDAVENQQFPSSRMPELYAVPVKGGRVRQVLSIPAENAHYNDKGDMLVFQDKKGYEDPWRKHHKSSVTRDIWIYEPVSKLFSKLTDFEGEDREPVFSKDAKTVYYLSEEKGSFNIFSMELRNSREKKQLTKMDKHPIRFLTIADNNTLCFHYNGEIYTMTPGGNPQKVKIKINADDHYNDVTFLPVRSATEFNVSPNGKEVVYVFRGEVFVSAVEGGITKRITNTPEQERNVSFSPDGRSILYAGERRGSWNIYQSKLTKTTDKYFFNSTVLEESAVLESSAETFQPAYSPDGKEVAFLEERTELKVINLETKAIRSILKKDQNYSYSDGDQYYQWCPDGKWFLVDFLQPNQWIGEVGLIKADGSSEVVNLTRSGYNDGSAKWMMDGKMMIWFSDRDGMKNHASWGSQMDIYAMFFTQDAFDRFRLTKEEYELLKEQEKDAEKDKDKEKEGDKSDEKDKKDEKDKPIEPIKIDMHGLFDRKTRLTIHSSQLNDAVLDKDGEKLYYLASFEKGFDLWETNLRTKETKIVQKLATPGGALVMDKKGENLFLLSGGKIQKISLKDAKKTPVEMKGEMELNEAAEREYLFEHQWRQVLKKFYRADLHGVDWNFYKKEYQRFLPHINNGHDFAEMSSELLGELNASHTGCRYRSGTATGDNTASLGIYIDYKVTGKGIKIAEVMQGSPLEKAGSKIKAGTVIEKIDGEDIGENVNYWPMLNRKTDQYILLSLYDPASGERWEETIKPISRGEEMQLRYKSWVERCRALTDKYSGGKIGYVHVTGMDNESFKRVYEEALGLNYGKEALIVDTRFNGGGWLHDDLATFLAGHIYMNVQPRGQNLGTEPMFKWSRPSAVLMSEGNYSDAHLFPYTYKALHVGKLVGMPVPGTGTAVWWETMQNGMVFGIPQVGMLATDGKYMENTQLEPDIKVMNEYHLLLKGEDPQIEAAVKDLLQQLKK